MQAIIPVAGAGTRLRPLTYTQPKALISVAGKPILAFIIDELVENNVTDFIFVVGYLGEKIKEYVEEHYPHLKTRFVTQENREGLGHAVWCAREEVDMSKDLVIQLGDTILDFDLQKMLNEHASTLCVKKVEDPRMFGVAEVDENGSITNLVEKPSIPKSNLAIVGFYYIRETAKLFAALDELVASNERSSNEIQLTQALNKLVHDGVKFKSLKVDSWFDVGKKDVLLETNSILLKKLGDKTKGEGTYVNCIIVPPVSISKGAKISNSIIGPNVTVGENTDINFSIIKESIIGSFSKLEHVVLHDSLIGSDTLMRGQSQSLNIGDNTEIDFSGEKN